MCIYIYTYIKNNHQRNAGKVLLLASIESVSVFFKDFFSYVAVFKRNIATLIKKRNKSYCLKNTIQISYLFKFFLFPLSQKCCQFLQMIFKVL